MGTFRAICSDCSHLYVRLPKVEALAAAPYRCERCGRGYPRKATGEVKVRLRDQILSDAMGADWRVREAEALRRLQRLEKKAQVQGDPGLVERMTGRGARTDLRAELEQARAAYRTLLDAQQVALEAHGPIEPTWPPQGCGDCGGRVREGMPERCPRCRSASFVRLME